VGRWRRRSPIAAVGLASIVVLSACSQKQQQSAQAIADSHAVSFHTQDGVRLEGRLFGPDDATAGVVFAHMLPSDQTAWFTYADRLAQDGYRALTFNFRGYCPGGDGGCSAGDKDPSAAAGDLAAALAFLRSNGVERAGLVGASLGGTASLVLAAQEENGIEAVVTLSAPDQIGGLVAGPDVLATITAAKLFIAGLGDTTAADAAQSFYDQSQPPKRVEILTTDDHGTDILEGVQGERAKQLISSWIEQYVPLTTPSAQP
jgi:pimeloyl-ACP methyl ester carboxylesterase